MKTLPIAKLLALQPNDTVSVVGSGGKTSLCMLLSGAFSGAKTLFTTTTRIAVPDAGANTFFGVDVGDIKAYAEKRGAGRYILAPALSADGRKCIGYEPEALALLLPCFDYRFIESDGAKGKPMKGWAPHEPVVIPETTVTIGVISIRTLGLSVNEANVHRLALFRAMLHDADASFIRAEHLRDIVLHPAGLFKSAQGGKALFINQADDEPHVRAGIALARLILKTENTLPPFKVIVGSACQNKGVLIQRD